MYLFSMIVRARLRRLLRQRKISKVELSKALDMAPVTVGRNLTAWENDGRVTEMPLVMVDRILEVLQLPASTLETSPAPDEMELKLLRAIHDGADTDQLEKRRILDLLEDGFYLDRRMTGEYVLTDAAKKVINMDRNS